MTTIKPKAVDFRGLKLSAEEGFVLSRIDGPTSVKELANLTALEEARVVEIVARLATEGVVDVEGAPLGGLAADPPSPAADDLAVDESEEASGASEGDASGGDGETDPDSAEADADLDEIDRVFISNERLYREVYAKKFKSEPLEQRVLAGRTGHGSDLLALCLDPDPQVVFAIMQNPQTGLEQARALAFHHRTHMGLETVAKRADFLTDNFVQRKLLRNPQLPDSILRRIVSRKVLIEVYKIAIDREIPERTRGKVRVELRKKFMLATADERAALLVKTEARVLVLLVDCALDARTTQILVSRSGYSILFVQNVARWSPSPPKLLAHLMGLQTVRRNPGVRKMLLRHPNMPTDVKKKFA